MDIIKAFIYGKKGVSSDDGLLITAYCSSGMLIVAKKTYKLVVEQRFPKMLILYNSRHKKFTQAFLDFLYNENLIKTVSDCSNGYSVKLLKSLPLDRLQKLPVNKLKFSSLRGVL